MTFNFKRRGPPPELDLPETSELESLLGDILCTAVTIGLFTMTAYKNPLMLSFFIYERMKLYDYD